MVNVHPRLRGCFVHLISFYLAANTNLSALRLNNDFTSLNYFTLNKLSNFV